MLKLIFVIASLALASTSAHAECSVASCKAWESGNGSKVGQPTKCIVEIVAPTFGGQIGLDVRNADGVSRWSAPRIKQVTAGSVTFKIGCNWLEQPTAQVYLCAKGPDGKQFSSKRSRGDPEFDSALTTKRVELCLKGRECPRFVER